MQCFMDEEVWWRDNMNGVTEGQMLNTWNQNTLQTFSYQNHQQNIQQMLKKHPETIFLNVKTIIHEYPK